MTDKIKITVVMPCYNAGKYLERTISFLDAQTYCNFEVILINDGSSDNTKLIANKVVAERSNYRLFSYENQGLSSARNHGLDMATGDYVYFLDADDFILPTMFERMVDMIIINNQPDAVRCGSKWIYHEKINPDDYENLTITNESHVLEGNAIINKISYSAIGYSVQDLQDYYTTGKFNFRVDFSPVWVYFYKRSTLMENKIRFVDGLQMIEDRIFNVTFAAYAKKVVYTDDIYYFYIVNADGLMNRIQNNYIGLYNDKIDAVNQRESMRLLYKHRLGIDISPAYRGSNVVGCIQVGLCLANLSPLKSLKMYKKYVEMPSVQESLIGFSLNGAPAKFKIPMMLLQHKNYILLLTLFYIAKLLGIKQSL